MGFTVLFPVLAPLGREIGLSEIQITTIIAASALTVFLTSPIWGRLSDQWGRKKVILIGLFGFAKPAPIRRRTYGRPETTCQTSG